MLVPSPQLPFFVSLLLPILLAFPAVADLFRPSEVNASALAPLSNVTFGATPWPPAPFEWSQRGIVELLPHTQSVTIRCISYDARPFSISEKRDIRKIARDFYRMLELAEPMERFPEDTISLGYTGYGVRVTILNALDQPGRRHTNLSIAEAMLAFANHVAGTGIGHSATIVPIVRRIPLTNWVMYRPVRIDVLGYRAEPSAP